MADYHPEPNRDDINVCLLGKNPTHPVTRLNRAAMDQICDSIATGIHQCSIRKCDHDMFVCIQGNRMLPASGIHLQQGKCDFKARMEFSVDGNLRFVCDHGGFILNVIFVGGGNMFSIDKPGFKFGSSNRRGPSHKDDDDDSGPSNKDDDDDSSTEDELEVAGLTQLTT